MRRDYYLFKRKRSPYYQVRIAGQDLSVEKLRGKLGGQYRQVKPTSRAAATKIVEAYLERFGAPESGIDAFDFLHTFWTDRSDYIRAQKARGRSLSREYLSDNQKILNRFSIYLHERRVQRIEDITPQLINAYLLQIKEQGVSGRRCNGILQAIAVPLNAYYKGRGEPERSPARLVAKFPEDKKVRRLWTPEEVQRLFADTGLWVNDRVMAANLLAAVSGMRRGEICGLQIDDVAPDYINVCHNWQGGRLVAPKWGSVRMVPIPDKVIDLLKTVYQQNPWGNQFVFWGARRDAPLSGRDMLRGLSLAMEAAGITKQEAQSRGLTFHAWRHWYNTMLRGRLPDHELRALTGHSSDKMTDHYTQKKITEDMARAVQSLAAAFYN